jgi:hypothetical protein
LLLRRKRSDNFGQTLGCQCEPPTAFYRARTGFRQFESTTGVTVTNPASFPDGSRPPPSAAAPQIPPIDRPHRSPRQMKPPRHLARRPARAQLVRLVERPSRCAQTARCASAPRNGRTARTAPPSASTAGTRTRAPVPGSTPGHRARSSAPRPWAWSGATQRSSRPPKAGTAGPPANAPPTASPNPDRPPKSNTSAQGDPPIDRQRITEARPQGRAFLLQCVTEARPQGSAFLLQCVTEARPQGSASSVRNRGATARECLPPPALGPSAPPRQPTPPRSSVQSGQMGRSATGAACGSARKPAGSTAGTGKTLFDSARRLRTPRST